MVHFVAKELGMRPYTILTEWTIEELLVAYGEYANIHAKESYDMMSPKERAKKHIQPLDRYAVLFIPLETALEMQNNPEEDFEQTQIDLQNAADFLMS